MMRSVRVVFLGGILSYRALFQWLRPSLFIPTMLVTPIFQVLFFVNLGHFAAVANDRFFITGNAVLGCAIACIYGPMLALAEERSSGVLSPVLATPASRTAIFLGRMIPYVLNGFFVSCFTLLLASALLRQALPAGQFPALALILAVSAATCTGLGLTLGALGLVWRDVPFVSNLVSVGMLLVCGANVALSRLPTSLRVIGEGLPLTRGIEAARQVAGGASLGSVAGLIAGEVITGVVYFGFAVVLLRLVERMTRRAGTLDLR
jgi:ABC-2 type transport system permease protein